MGELVRNVTQLSSSSDTQCQVQDMASGGFADGEEGRSPLISFILIKDEKSNVKISLKYVSSKEIYNKLQKLGFIMFFTLFIEMLVMSILVLINILSPVISIPVIIITGFIFSLLILKMSIKEK